jgi:hypothetical protein
MIDGIAGVADLRVVKKDASKPAASGGTQGEAKSMDMKTLLAEHPDVYQAILDAGATGERDRVCAHLTMGASSGDMKTAIDAIKDGSLMTATLQSTYMAAGMKKAAVNVAAADSAVAAEAAGGVVADAADADATAGKNILNAAAEECGVEVT